ncbi:MAG: hypothetical protein JNL58_11640 [Planctomyces sp.]|nr:hypothetical protein [Planctomyces sp.]
MKKLGLVLFACMLCVIQVGCGGEEAASSNTPIPTPESMTGAGAAGAAPAAEGAAPAAEGAAPAAEGAAPAAEGAAPAAEGAAPATP